MAHKRKLEVLRCEVQKASTLTPEETAELRKLLRSAFQGDFSELDWAHALGGTHILVRLKGSIVAHVAVVPRTIWIDEHRIQAAYIEAVAVAPEAQHKGLGTMAMQAAEPVIEQYDLGVLSTGRHSFYSRFGWERWRGPSWVRGERGEIRTASEDEGIMVKRTRRTRSLTLSEKITCEKREGDDW